MHECKFIEERFKRHDREKVVHFHIAHVEITWPYIHVEWEKE
jgi:hypothetical protein